MKAAVLVILTSYFFLLNLIPLAFSSQDGGGGEPVRDFQGVPLSSARHYTISPAYNGPLGGGVGPDLAVGNTKCPVTILQDPSETEPGKPVKFTVTGGGTAILTGESLEIEFVDKPSCATSSKWVAVVDNNFPGKWFGIGGANDHPGSTQIITGTFKIQNFDSGYKLVFCPTATGAPCSNIVRQIADDYGHYRLLLSKYDGAFSFRFTNHP